MRRRLSGLPPADAVAIRRQRRAAAEKAAMRAVLTDLIGGGDVFKGAATNRLTMDWSTGGVTPKDEYQNSARVLRNRCRELGRNNAFFKRYLNAIATNIIGHKGSTLRPVPPNTALEQGWYEWSQEPVTLDAKLDRVRFEHLAIKTLARDGELFIRLWRGTKFNRFGLALEPIDPDLVQETYNRLPSSGGNEIRLGIEVNSLGRPVNYNVCDSADPMLSRRTYAIPARDIIHIYDPDRVQQTRGIPWAASIMLPLRWLQSYIEAELVASRQAASKGGFVQKKEGSPGASLLSEKDQQFFFEVNPGSVDILPTGYEFKEYDPQHPAGAFPDFVKMVLLEVSAGLNVAYSTITGDTSMANYSSMRSGKLDERAEFRRLQDAWAAMFLKPVFSAWLETAVDSGEVQLGTFDTSEFLDVNWIARGWDWVDPQTDVEAAVKAIQAGLSSRKRYLDSQGIDITEVLKELGEENEAADRLKLDISGQKPTATAPGERPENANGNGNGNGNGKPPKRLAPYLEGAR